MNNQNLLSSSSMADCFSYEANAKTFAVKADIYRQKSCGYVQIKEGVVYVNKKSIVAQKAQRLVFGLGKIDFLLEKKEKNMPTLVCLRDERVQVSEYIMVPDFDPNYIKKGTK